MIRSLDFNDIPPSEFFLRPKEKTDVSSTVKDIINEVITNGDNALYAYAEKFDGVKLDSLVVSEDEFNEACENLIKDILYTNDKIFSKISELKYLELKEAEYLEEKRGVTNV